MSEAVKQLLEKFDGLTAAEKRKVAGGLLRRVADGESGDIPDEALVAAAEELFLELDARQSPDGQT